MICIEIAREWGDEAIKMQNVIDCLLALRFTLLFRSWRRRPLPQKWRKRTSSSFVRLLWGGGGESAGCVAVRHQWVLVGGFGRSGALNPGTPTDGDGKLNSSVQLWGSHQRGNSLTLYFLFLTHLCPQVKGSWLSEISRNRESVREITGEKKHDGEAARRRTPKCSLTGLRCTGDSSRGGTCLGPRVHSPRYPERDKVEYSTLSDF